MKKRLIRKLNFHDFKCLICGYLAQELWELSDKYIEANVHVCELCGKLTADEMFKKVLN